MGPDARRQLVSLPFALVLVDPAHRIAALNPAAEQLLGQSARRLMGRALSEAITFGEVTLCRRVSEGEAQLSARSTPVQFAGQAVRRLDVTLAPVIDFPGWQMLTLVDLGGVGSLSDEDSLLRAPEVLAHEIKNPLAGIRGAAQLLARKLDDKDRALTTLIAGEVDRIANLIDQMQTLSRRSSPPLEPCNLHESVRRAVAVITTAREPMSLREEFDPSLPPVQGNADALVQVVLNLLTNAHEAAEGGQAPQVVIRTRFASGLQFQRAGGEQPVRLPIELRVSDNGPGIDPAVRDHVFEPFVTSKKSGQGLGLALVRRLVRDMNGRIGMDRDEEAGWTHFHVHLPVALERRGAGSAGACAA
ncbi:two-component system sensor histidine kinase NtrB [Parablastomonas sp. CN1-191]|uniref:two-component system sensor histidine kinase NtrB n=1 Tax=Parablastomonas sp. CN1-191 TaxID=3400908 RepID=UPI003BF7C364